MDLDRNYMIFIAVIVIVGAVTGIFGMAFNQSQKKQDILITNIESILKLPSASPSEAKTHLETIRSLVAEYRKGDMACEKQP